MNAFKRSEKPTHKLYSNIPSKKEFVTNQEFVLGLSVDSVDLNQSFSSLESSFFSHGSSKPDMDLINQLKEAKDNSGGKCKPFQLPEELISKKPKEEDTNYTVKPMLLKLESDEFKKGWFCHTCAVNDSDSRKRNCEMF